MKQTTHLRTEQTGKKAKKKPIPASHTKTFTDEEAKILEKEFIEAYSGSSKSTLKILLIMYKRYPLQLFWSIFFYFIATLPHIIIPVITANLINIAVKVNELGASGYPDYLVHIGINIGILVFLLLLNIHYLYNL